MKNIKKLIFLKFVLLLSTNVIAMDDLIIYAQTDGSYTYKEKNYLLKEFPLEQVLKDHVSGQEAPTVDSVAPITVSIFPVESVDVNGLRKLVRPLAIKFHRRGAVVNTLFIDKVIPYRFKKPEFFKPLKMKY